MLYLVEESVDFMLVGYIFKLSPPDGMEMIKKIPSGVECNQRNHKLLYSN